MGFPPAAGTRMTPRVRSPKMITSSRLHEPPETKLETSQIVCGGPPLFRLIFLSFLSEPKTMVLLSGDQKGDAESGRLSVSGRSLASSSPIRCTHTCSTPSDRAAKKASVFPSGEMEKVLRPIIRRPSGIGMRKEKGWADTDRSLAAQEMSATVAPTVTARTTAAASQRQPPRLLGNPAA